MDNQKKKGGQAPNLKSSLIAAILMIVLIFFCIIDTLKNMSNGTPIINIGIVIFIGIYAIALLWGVCYIIKRIKTGKN